MKFYEDPENVLEMSSDTEACTTDDSSSEDDNSVSSGKVDENKEDVEDSKDGIVLRLKPFTVEKEEKDSDVVLAVCSDSPLENRIPSFVELSTPQNYEETTRETNPGMYIPSLREHITGNALTDYAGAATNSIYLHQWDADEMNALIPENDCTSFDPTSADYERQLDEADRRELERSTMNEAHFPLAWDG